MDISLPITRSEDLCVRTAPPRSLIDARFDHDSCGVGFVAASTGAATHKVLTDALTALARLAHRGAVAADGKSSDGVGIMTVVPRGLLLRQTGVPLREDQALGVGVVFVSEKDANTRKVLAACLGEQGLDVLAWRGVPVRAQVLGEIALSTMPEILHVLVSGAQHDGIERKLYLARKSFERRLETGEVTGYIASLSSKTIVYKSMCIGRLLPEFYPDLQDESFVTPFALFHQRYATNTTPAWHRAQPGRTLAHNGEINTVWGNRARMEARYSTLPAECMPILTADGTDSTSLDETVELLTRNGRTVAEAIRILLPPAVASRESAFLKYHMDVTEPWDGPAALAFTDGRYVGAALDRNGLRPSRFAITSDGLVVAGSEAGLVDLDPETVVHSGRLGPGQMLVVDLQEQNIYENDELLDLFDAGGDYPALLDDRTIQAEWIDLPPTDLESIAQSQRRFGYTKEDVRMVLLPMATDAKDAVWSMGDDTPLAYLAKTPRPIYAYFRQRFAQVTNPAIDPLREAIVVSLHTRLGPWSHMLSKNAGLAGLSLNSPFLSIGKLESLRQGRYPHSETALRMRELKCVFSARYSLETGVEALCANAVELVNSGVEILLLSDRNAEPELLPIPMAMAVSVVHHALVKAGLRTHTGIVAEAGDVRDVHHAAVLIGYGAGAVCPWLALETARATAGAEGDPKVPEVRMLKAFDAGLAKIMSKMGVSVVDSYRGAYPFDILGLSNEVVDRCFPRTPAPLGGAGFAEIEHGIRHLWGAPLPAELQAKVDLPDYGWIKFRKADVAEPHAWQPSNVKALQSVVGSARNVPLPEDPAKSFQMYSQAVAAKETPTVLRELLEIRPAGPEVALEEVEAPGSLMKRFVSSAMSLGSLSPEAHSTITIAMNMIGGKSNTGEGGEDSDVYRPHPGNRRIVPEGEAAAFVTKSAGGVAVAEPIVEAPAVHAYLNNKIKQIASGRFGVTAEYLAHAEEIEIKVAQGAKPGEGGQLPGHKVTGLIARLRHAQSGVPLISPPPHHDIYSIEDLAELIHDLKRVNARAAVGVKLVSSCGVGTVAAGVAKAYADYVVIAGNSGGTGAAALSSIKYAGNPWELGLAEAQQTLVANGMRDRVRLRTDGGLSTARDVLIAALLGADEYAFGTAVLVVLGCDMARQCHLNTCPTGIATQKPELRARFRGKPEHVVRFFHELTADLQQMLARYGLRSIEEAIGRVDLLEQVRTDGGLDLSPMLAVTGDGPRSWAGIRNDRPQTRPALDEEWVQPALTAVERGDSFEVDSEIANKDRAVGARIAGELSVLRAKAESPMPTPSVTLRFHGTAGQSFGAFAIEGMHLQLTGQANDFVGKGLSGGELVLRARGLAARDSGQHVILGNVALYGATGGKLFAAGRAGERFAVRNSGAIAVVEGIGDHGCEYMTGGTAVVLGGIGLNFGAGMTGGSAWIFDEAGTVLSGTRYHADFLQAVPFANAGSEAQSTLFALLEEHAARSESSLAAQLLANWAGVSARFLHMVPVPQA